MKSVCLIKRNCFASQLIIFLSLILQAYSFVPEPQQENALRPEYKKSKFVYPEESQSGGEMDMGNYNNGRVNHPNQKNRPSHYYENPQMISPYSGPGEEYPIYANNRPEYQQQDERGPKEKYTLYSKMFNHENGNGGGLDPNGNGPKFYSNNFDMDTQNSNHNLDASNKRSSGYMCHFKLCQLGASGKRRWNPAFDQEPHNKY